LNELITACGADNSVVIPVSRESAVIFYTPFLKLSSKSLGEKLQVSLSKRAPESYI